MFLIGPPVLDGDVVGDRSELLEVSGIDDEDEDDEDGEGKAIGNNVEDMNDEGMDVATIGSSIITSNVSEMFSTVTSLCVLVFCALEPLPERLNSLCKSCTC